MSFSPFDYFLWAIVFLLELAGAILTFPRQKALSSLLWFRAAADVFGFLLLQAFGMTAFQWEDYLQRMIQFPLLGILAICCAGCAAGDSRGVRIYSGPFAAGVAVWLAAVHGSLPWNLTSVLWIAEKTVFGLAAVVGIAFILRYFEVVRGEMESPWKATSAGLLILLSTSGLAMLARQYHWLTWANAGRGGQIGAILAQLVWVAGPAQTLLREWKASQHLTFNRLVAEEVYENRMIM